MHANRTAITLVNFDSQAPHSGRQMKFNLKPGLTIGDGARSFVVEKATNELIHVRTSQENNPLRFIPTAILRDLVEALRTNQITIQDISRKYRSDAGLPHLFDELKLNYDKFALGYDATFQKLCEYILENPAEADLFIESRSSNSVSVPKPLLLLAGISGTGKSRFVREQAKFHPQNDNFCLVAVRPDWHEPSDLLGYSSRLSGKTEYVATDVLRFLVVAWRGLLQQGFALEGDGSRTLLTGNSSQLDAAVPFWLCLDEMNLAPVEQYFADYLALIETRDWSWDADDFEYGCDALLNASALGELEPEQQEALARTLQLETEDESGTDHLLWQHFLEHGIAIPPNLIVAGTVNMDETTHGFSRKVIDRAMSFDFGEFFPNDFDDFLEGQIQHAQLTFPRHSSGKDAIVKDDAMPSIGFLKAVNSVLKGSPFELAYRALNELLLAAHCHGTPKPGADLQAVWDDFLMQKVLPRIEGDADKLQSNGDHNLLTRLHEVLEVQLADIWADGETRTDFYRLKNDQPARTACRSRIKLQWMLDRLNSSGFTSFWP